MTCLVKFIAFSCVLTAFSFSAGAQDAAYDSVIDQISKATLSAKEGGYTVVKTVWIEKIEKGHVARFTSRFAKGTGCLIASRCDKDCADVRLSVKNAAGQEVVADREGRVKPEVSFISQTTGEYNVELRVPGCKAAICTAGIGVFCSNR